MKISVLGPQKTFSDLAYYKYNKEYEPIYFNTIKEVISNVNENLGIIPIENTLDGYVEGTFDLLLEKNLKIIDEIFIPVKFSLVSKAKRFEDIKRIYVQFKAKGQCQKFFDNFNKEIIITESNMKSLELMKENEGAIVPSHVYNEKNFGIPDVTDSKENETRFGIISKEMNSALEGEVKAILCITALNDKPGLLYGILGKFAALSINLTSIMSRPTKQKMGSYNFFIELNGLVDDINYLMTKLQSDKNISVVNLGFFKKAR